jgi:hypothetical protein
MATNDWGIDKLLCIHGFSVFLPQLPQLIPQLTTGELGTYTWRGLQRFWNWGMPQLSQLIYA